LVTVSSVPCVGMFVSSTGQICEVVLFEQCVQLINNHDIHKTQSSLNLSTDKILVLTKYWRRQNIGIDKILVLAKHWR
jgi:hypothetical protein